MIGRVEKLGRSPHAELSNASQTQLLDAASSQGAGNPQDCREESAEGFARIATPRPSRKRRIGTISDVGPLPAKRARLARTDTQRSGVEGKKIDQLVQTPQQPKPTPPRRSCASLVDDSVHPPVETINSGKTLDVEHSPPKRATQVENDVDDAAVEPGSRKQTPVAPKPLPLTRKNLRELDRMTRSTKPGAASESAKSKMTPSSTTKTTKTDKTISTTASGFREQAIANGILCPRRSMPPGNVKETLDRLNESRGTASPPESQYRRYCKRIDKAGNEAAVLQRMLPLFKEYDGDEYDFDMNRAFSALPKDVGFNDGLSAPQPDFVQGLSKEEFLPFDPAKISGAVLFKDDRASMTLPHFAGEWKSRSGDMDDATLQSSYDGAALVYGRNQAREHLGEPDLSSSAVTTFISNGEHITFFAHHASPTGVNEKMQYHQSRLVRTDLTDSYESFKKGRRQIRNAQDYAREHSIALRDQLRKQWEAQQGQDASLMPQVQPSAVQVEADEDDEDADDDAGCEVIKETYQPAPPTSSKRERKPSRPEVQIQPSEPLPVAADAQKGSVSSSRHKRKSSHGSAASYWTKDKKTGRYFHVHADGVVDWKRS